MKGKKKSFAEKIKKEGWMKIDCHPLAVWLGSTIVTVLLLELLSRKSLFSLLAYVFDKKVGICQRTCGDFLGRNRRYRFCFAFVSNNTV